MLSFGSLTLPALQTADLTDESTFTETDVVGRNVAYRRFLNKIGRIVQASGYYKSTRQGDVLCFIGQLRRYADNVSRLVDLGDGSAPFYALLSSPSVGVVVGDWYDGYYRISWTVIFQENPSPTAFFSPTFFSPTYFSTS
jgi:hypothetical protein